MKHLLLSMAAVCSLTCAAYAEQTLPATDFGTATVAPGTSKSEILTFSLTGFTAKPSFSLQFGIDFWADSPTCNSNWTTCTLQVTFAPRFPGVRQDAVLLKDNSDRLISRVIVHGIGQGPQVSLYPSLSRNISVSNFSDGIAIDPEGNLYASSQFGNSVEKISPLGFVTTVAGLSTGGYSVAGGYSGDGGPATDAQLNGPTGLALDGAGNLYICDTGNYRIRRVDAVTGIITTFAGNGISGYSGDNGPATGAEFTKPSALAFDASGVLYIADSGANVIRRVDALTGTITTIAGTGAAGYSGDGGPATAATLNNPVDLAVAANGDLYVADAGNYRIRKISAGVISTFAGTGTPGYSADGTSAVNAQFRSITGIALDAGGRLYVVDGTGTSTIRMISAVAPNPLSTMPATGNFVPTFTGIRVDAAGTLYVPGTSGVFVSPDPAPLQFATTHIGTADPPQKITLSNTGSAPLNVSGIFFSGGEASDFAQSNDCGTVVAAGASCTVTITFNPTATGNRDATLFIADDDPGSPQMVPVFGSGQAVFTATAVATPGTLDFGTQSLGAGIVQSVVLTSSGPGPILFNYASLSGPNPGDFTIIGNNCSGNINPGFPCSIQVSFSPTAIGTRSGTLSIGTAGSTITVPLTGMGVPDRSLIGRPGDVRSIGDFDGDGRLDFAVWRPSNGTWYVMPSSHPNNPIIQQWGLPADIAVPGDYDGDGITDFAIWRPSTGTWFVLTAKLRNQYPTASMQQQWGLPSDIPMPGDYDGDGKTDFAIWRPSDGTWWVLPSSDPSHPLVVQWGLPGDVPVSGDFDGDRKLDYAVYRPSNGTWFVMTGTLRNYPAPTIQRQWGLPGDIPLAGDFDGDGNSDFAVWRAANASWFILPSGNPAQPMIQQWGFTTDIPVPGDIDGDGKTDLTVWRPSEGTWYVHASNAPNIYPFANIFQQWGLPGDVPM